MKGDMELIKKAMRLPETRKRLRDTAFEDIWAVGDPSIQWLPPSPPGLPVDVWGIIVGFFKHETSSRNLFFKQEAAISVTKLLLVSKAFSPIVLRYFKFDKKRTDTRKLLQSLVFSKAKLHLWRTYGFVGPDQCIDALHHNTDIASRLPSFLCDKMYREAVYFHNLFHACLSLKSHFAQVAVCVMRLENPVRDTRLLFWLFNRCRGFECVDIERIPRCEKDIVLQDKCLNLKKIDTPTFYDLTNMYNAYRYIAKHYYDLDLPELVPLGSLSPVAMFNKVDVAEK